MTLRGAGGASNILEGGRYHGRFRLRVARRDIVSDTLLQTVAANIVRWIGDDLVHMLMPDTHHGEPTSPRPSNNIARPAICALVGMVALSCVFAAVKAEAQESLVRLIPVPAEIQIAVSGRLTIADGAPVAASPRDTGAVNAAAWTIETVARVRGLHLEPAAKGGLIRFVRVPLASLSEAEGYRLDVKSDGVTVTAATDAGLLHGSATLAQLLSPDAGFGAPVSLPLLAIRDQPRFAWRGIMLDVARHMLPIKDIETVIDMMAQHKLNILQLHLTDDQGWRIEIRRFPELTRIGAWRQAPVTGSPTDGHLYGGFYTQDELRALVAYATARGVTIVPEIDMPGHAQAAVAAYPEVGVLGDRPPVSNEWGINPYLFGVGEPNLRFIEQVLDEVLAIFPSRYIHIGGDEAIKEQWQASPMVQARMRTLGIKDEEALQSWFVDQLGTYLTRHGRRLIGWDEILEGGLRPSATVMSWRGEAGAVAAAGMGHDVVCPPGPILYLDNLQSTRADEPPGRLKVQSLADIYAYDPLPAAIPVDKAHHVLGAQANVWSEYLVTPEQVRHALFPRLDALAEIAWSPKAARDWPGFLMRLEPQLERYRRQGVTFADSAFAVDFAVQDGVAAALHAGMVTVTLANQVHYGTIRYTLDGSPPTVAAPAYSAPLKLSPGAVVHSIAFADNGRPLAAVRAFDTGASALHTRDSAGLEICPSDTGIRLRVALTPDATEGPAYNLNIFDSCWLYRAAPLVGVNAIAIDIGRLARHYALRAAQRRAVVRRYNPSRYGTVIVHLESCVGPIAASLPLPDPATTSNRFSISGTLTLPPGADGRDLCILAVPPEGGPIYGIERVSLRP